MRVGKKLKNIECLQRAVDYMEENMCHTMSITEIANYAYISERNLTELFTSITGLSVTEYVRQRRLTEAAYEILHTKDKILDISYKYGYESQESFSRAFRRFHGLSPQQLRSKKEKPKEQCKVQFINNNVVGADVCNGYRVLENGPIYYTNDMDIIVEWFRNVLGWVANIDARNEAGEGMFGCAMPISDDLVSEKLTTFLGFSLFYGEPLERVIGYITVDNVENLRQCILQNGWNKVTDIEVKPWGAREISITTPDGGIIKFSSYEKI